MDKDGYPTREDLKSIREWDVIKKGVRGLVDILQDNWQFADIGCLYYETKGKKFKLELHTLGWSGNEEIIGVLKETDFWFIYWQKSERGGHFYFEGRLEEEKLSKAELRKAVEQCECLHLRAAHDRGQFACRGITHIGNPPCSCKKFKRIDIREFMKKKKVKK